METKLIGVLTALLMTATLVQAQASRMSPRTEGTREHQERGRWGDEDEDRRFEAEERREAAKMRREDATRALVSAHVEIFSLMVEQEKKDAAMAQLDKIASIKNLGEDPEAQEQVLQAYLEGVEFLIDLGENERAEKLGKQGLQRFKGSDLHRGYFLMSLATIQKRQGKPEKALASLQEATELFEQARKE